MKNLNLAAHASTPSGSSSLSIWSTTPASLVKQTVQIGGASLNVFSDFTLTDFAKSAVDGRISVTYQGNDWQQALRYLKSWRKALIVYGGRSSNRDHIVETLPWKFEVIDQQDDAVYFRMKNWLTNQSVFFAAISESISQIPEQKLLKGTL